MIFRKRKHYIFCYFFKSKNDTGFGNVCIEANRRIFSIDDIRKVEETILKDNNDFEEVVIIFWTEL